MNSAVMRIFIEVNGIKTYLPTFIDSIEMNDTYQSQDGLIFSGMYRGQEYTVTMEPFKYGVMIVSVSQDDHIIWHI